MVIAYYCLLCDETSHKGRNAHVCKEITMFYYRCMECDEQSVTGDAKNNQCCLNSDCKASHLYQETKPDSVGITENERLLQQMTPDAIAKFASNSIFAKEIWNAAIEAAAKHVDLSLPPINGDGIRKLKK